MSWKPHAITFGGGGARIVGSFGVLTHLIDTGMTALVTDWYGCSAGAMCALFAAIGVSSTWLREVASIFDARLIGAVREDYVYDFAKVWGAASTENLREILGKFIETWEPGASAWTFSRLPGLHISATNVSRGRAEIFDSVNSPNMNILDAVCASSTIPFFFAPWIHPETGEIFCDGGITGSYPWSCIPNKDETLAIVCADKDIIGRPPRQLKHITTIFDYFTRLISLGLHRDTQVIPRYWIAVNNRTIYSIDFNITKEELLAAFEEGVQTAKGWMAFGASMQDSLGETAGSRPWCAPQDTSAAVHSSQGKTMDNHRSDSSRQPLDPVRDSRSGPKPCVRRWSL